MTTAHRMIKDYLTYGNHAATELRKLYAHGSEDSTQTNAVIASITIVGLLGELRALDPQRADLIADRLYRINSSPNAAFDTIYAWSNNFVDGREITVPAPVPTRLHVGSHADTPDRQPCKDTTSATAAHPTAGMPTPPACATSSTAPAERDAFPSASAPGSANPRQHPRFREFTGLLRRLENAGRSPAAHDLWDRAMTYQITIDAGIAAAEAAMQGR